MEALPIDGILGKVREAVRGHCGVVVVAAPGAGKTTRVPGAVLEVLGREHPHAIMLQPRRVAARAAAQRIAEERGWRLGEEVGYHIRFEKRYGRGTRIRVLTEAILTRMLLSDASLEGIGCVILDEFHERNLHTDLGLAYLREVQQTIRPDLKLVVMSATLEAEAVAGFLGGKEACPILRSEGRVYPVEIGYRAGATRERPLEVVVAGAVEEALEFDGDVLVFLPGVGEIERCRRALRLGEGVAVLPLHGSLTSEEQQAALRPAGGGRRKVILATNIAETSLTIEGIRTVVDSGLVRVASYDPDRGMDRLDLEAISQASATQRAGRAGRQGPGRVIRLWSPQKPLAEFNVPEVRRVDLAGAVLAVHAWGAREVRGFGWFERPEEGVVAGAEELLGVLGALREGRLTELGRQMMGVPAHPRIARLLLAAVGTRLQEEAVRLAAVLADEGRSGAAGTDPLVMMGRTLPELARMREQFSAIVRGMGAGIENREWKIEKVEELLLLAYPDRIARRRGADPFAAVMVGGVGLRLAAEALTPALVAAPLFLALDAHHDLRNKRAEATVRTATPVAVETLERLFAGAFRTEAGLQIDAAKQKVVAVTRRYFADLLLAEDPHGKVDPERAGEVLAEALGERAGELFGGDERAGKLLARVALVRHYMPEVGWPKFDAGELRELLKQACAGKRSVAEVMEGGALAEVLRSALVYPLDRKLEQNAPEAIEVPSGSRIKLEYALPANEGAPPPAPVLAVRLQEMFGLLETPRVAGGRVAVLLHLLSPGYKPMQITSDLRSFWAGAYFEVRKDLRVRYPKHKWPEDPLTAVPEAKGRRRG